MASTSGAAGTAGTGSESEGEEQEDPSSSDVQETAAALEILSVENSKTEIKYGGDELSAFRQQWQRELESTPSPRREPTPKVQEVIEDLSDEDKAKKLFMLGVELERSGKLYEAIQKYKRAMQILPDVETRLYEGELRPDTPVEEEIEEVLHPDNASTSDDEDFIEGEELVTRLQRIVGRRGVLCEPEHPIRGAHISWLPYELVLVVLRWVVSGELDAAALERVSAACRGLHVAARDPDLWRSLCVKTWGIDCGTPRAGGYSSWRDMYISRPRLLLNGCYISKTTYLRHGENSFQDQFYRPWYIVDYYRYLRFFSDGVVVMWNTPDEPAACVALLRARTPRPATGALAGHYRLLGDKVVIIVKKTNEKKPAQNTNTRFRSRRKENVAHETHDTTFHLELQLRDVRSRRNWQLVWRGYSVSPRREQWTHFELSPAKFPPFAFSQVRAYTAEAETPLPDTYSPYSYAGA